ncbi:hypothetical protein DIPPA_00034 [Diplonema papillatum]|nr:hypothetical protein DIPPA_00034 [Diplonema papillatum]
MINIERRLIDLNLTEIPSILKPDTALVKAILVQTEAGVRVPLDFSPKKTPLFPAKADAHSIAFSPMATRVDEIVLQEAKDQLGSAVETAHKNILLDISSKVDKDVMPSTTHVLMRIRHAVALLVCEVVQPKDALRLMIMVVGLLPLVASHTSSKGSYQAGFKYEEFAMKQATESSRDISASETLASLTKVDSEVVKRFKEKTEIEREQAKLAKPRSRLVTTSEQSCRYEPYGKPYGKASGKGAAGKPVNKGKRQSYDTRPQTKN